MANIGLDGRIRNDENGHDVPLRTKQMNLNEGRPLKKQVFGELKNVMHGQQLGLTPIKGNAAKIDGLPGKFGATSSLCNDLLRKQHLKQNFFDEQKCKANIAVGTYKEPVFDVEIFDSWDYDRKCCQHQKPEEEIWAEMDLERLNFDLDANMFRCKDDEDEEMKARSNDHIFFDDFDDDLPVPTFNSMIETDEPPLFEMPQLLNHFEDLFF